MTPARGYQISKAVRSSVHRKKAKQKDEDLDLIDCIVFRCNFLHDFAFSQHGNISLQTHKQMSWLV